MRRLLLAACLGLMALAPAAHAWPDRPVTIIAPFGPGTSVDIAARLLAPKLQAAWGQPVVVTNVPGSAGIIGVERAVRATDGHTILLSADAAIVVRVSMAPRPPYDPRRDLLPVSLLGRTTNILVVSNSFPARNLAELVAIARARPGSVTFGHAGNGTSQHIGGEMLAQMAGVELTGVAYNDAASQIQDVLTGRVTMSFQSGVVALPRLRDNAWRALAVSAPARMAALPDLPTVAEQGYPGFDAVAWLGVLAPASMPAANVARIHRDVVAALAEPELRGRLAELGVDVVGSTPEEFRALIEREIPRMAGVLGRAGIRPD
ncbi:tripartite tricarboxylate transporter substrate-binding protein [Sediminicoccus sp. KRV36]|uniref:Bug family tripartite tricarboxylate transporter substrate binding protein n=1 Tax=Sediminicoccus sp. KRV36 TaxID=3133721 RepID=UPI00200CDD67|nr:tripartite tricarboxylate transporter substrate-binding protein [Sediminicoccus rosea]UPY36291.1 tripartite tricarboxylate transporter substrate binding protein [Sediminicoccus rosea]